MLAASSAGGALVGGCWLGAGPHTAVVHAGAMLADDSLRLALLSSIAAPELLPALRNLAGACSAALAVSLPQRQQQQEEETAGAGAAESLRTAAQLALPAASLAARLALHLQLMSALVSAAEAAAAEQPGEREGAEMGRESGGQPAQEHMWSDAGWDATEEAIERAAKLLAGLRGRDWNACGAEAFSGARYVSICATRSECGNEPSYVHG